MARLIRALALALALVLGPAAATAAEEPPAVHLIEAQSKLVERTGEYRASLERLLALQEAELARAETRAREWKVLLDRGIVSRREAEGSERALAGALERVEGTRQRMAEADALMGETLAAIEVARMPGAPRGEVVATPAVVLHRGAVDVVDVHTLETFFAGRFGRGLPVSARGQTPVHDQMGLDHRHAIDVALHPDSDEGRAFMEYLRVNRIPFLAFRRPIPGASTGAHLHVGRASARLIPVRAIGR
jgi:hypothetical protein